VENAACAVDEGSITWDLKREARHVIKFEDTHVWMVELRVAEKPSTAVGWCKAVSFDMDEKDCRSNSK